MGEVRPLSELEDWIAARGGVAHGTALRQEGFTAHGLRAAVGAGVLTRVRRSWLATDACDPLILRAAQVGGRLTCVTAAERAGLWTPPHGHVHVAVPPTASRLPSDGMRLHWSRGPMAVASTSLEDPIVNVLFHVARCLAPRDALAVWESALNARLVAHEVLARVEWRSAAARALAAEASVLSDSGLETRFAVLMRGVGVAVRQQVAVDGHRVDGLIGEHLVVQLDGFAHHRAKDRRRDLRADARLSLRGCTVLRFDFYQVLFEPEYVVSVVTAAIAQGLHR